MMKLSNMVRGLASDAVAKSLIQNWEHDEGTLTFWRASSNFVYAFENKQEKYFCGSAMIKKVLSNKLVQSLNSWNI